MVTENMRVMKMVRLLDSLAVAPLLSPAASSGGMLPGVKDLARLLLRLRPSDLPSEFVPSCMGGMAALGSAGLGSRGTM